MWACRKTIGRPDSPTSDLRWVPNTIPEGSESDIFMLLVDDAGRVEGAIATKARRLVDLSLALKIGRAPYMGCVVSL